MQAELLDFEEIARKRDLVRAMDRRREMVRENGLLFYRPHFKQDLFHKAGNFKRRYARTGNRFGKPLAWYEFVLTYGKGFRYIRDIQEGDVVFDHAGMPTKVTGVFPQGRQKLFRFHFDDETHVDCCDGHLWTVKGPKERWNGKDWVVKTTRQIIDHVGSEPKNPKNRYVIPLTSRVNLPRRALPIAPYVLGALLGDGCFGTSIVITSADEEIVGRVIEELPEGCSITSTGNYGHRIVGEWHNSGKGRKSTNILPSLVEELGLAGTNSRSKFIPGIYLLSAPDQRLALVQGLLDTDGSVYAEGKAAEFVSCSERMANEFVFLVQSLGYKATISSRITKDQNQTPCLSYRVLIRQPKSELFHLTRKKNAVASNTGYERQRVIYKIEELNQEEECFCISVSSPLHTFLTTNLVVTHNSTMGAAEDIAWALGERIWYPKGSEARTIGIPKHPTIGVILCADWDKANEIFTDADKGKLMKLLPKSANVRTETNQSGNVDTIKVDSIYGGTSIIKLDTVKSFASNPMGHESSDWDWIHIDEPCPQEMYVAYVRGLVDRGGSVWFTCTPITELWINDMFFGVGQKKNMQEGPLVLDQRTVWRITGTTYDNPTLSKENIEEFSKDIPDKARASRLFGKPLQLEGVIYDEFDDAEHVFHETPVGWAEYDQPPPNWTIRIAIDIHEGIPQAVLFAATGPLGHTYFYAERFDTIRISAVCEQIKEILGGRRAYSIIADPRAWIETPRDGTTIADDFHENGIYCEPGPKDLTRGILKVKEMLKARDRNGHPMLNFSQHLTETLREFERYVYDPKTNKPHTKAPDHMMENLYRLCINGLEWVDPTEHSPIIKQVAITHAKLDLPKINFDLGQSVKKAMKLARYGRRG